MRTVIAIVFVCLVAALTLCAVTARRSSKSSAASVSLLLFALIPPMVGNLIIISSTQATLSILGCYIYFLGMDLVMFALLHFTIDYCGLSWRPPWVKWVFYGLLLADVVQMLANLVTHHAFVMEELTVGGASYFRFVPLAGQTIHRVVDYAIFLAVLIIFLYFTLRAPRVYRERYAVILLAMVVAGLWQTFYIFSRTPIDRSMIGFAVFGLMVFYFALYYRPMRLLDRMLANIASEMPEALCFFDAKDRCIWTNRPARALLNLKGQELERATERIVDLFGAPGTFPVQKTCDGRSYILDRRSLTDGKDNVVGSFLSIRDNTEEQQALQKERYNATHDDLTGLYNREFFYERTRDMLDAHPDREHLAIFVDVSEFKMVNDVFGTAFGDHALKTIAEWIKKDLSGDAVYGRLAGDTFGACIPVEDFHPARIEEDLSRFVVVDGPLEHLILIHLGVYAINEPELEVSVMFDRAHMALLTIKEDYQIHIAYYDDAMRESVLWNQHISSQLHEALETRQIVPYLQPIVNGGGRVVGAEALVRWNHPTDGFLSPAQFIPVFEKNGMIADVDRYMWRRAAEILAGWKAEGVDLFVSVNISPKDFFFMDVAETLKSIVKEYDVDPGKMRVEITETMMMSNVENRMRILATLKEAGFCVEMDDFGSGYSSLNLLKDMPVDVLKIDMMFLNESRNDNKAQTILHNIISLSSALGISALTEGVETRSQYQMLSAMGCNLFQGYYFARPMPVEDFERFRREHRPGAKPE